MKCSSKTLLSILITDSARYLLIRRVSDDVDETYQAHFQLSLPLGNRGILDLDSPESDLSPAFVRPPSLCHKPFGLWLALSFDDPDPNADDSPVKQRERPPPGKRPRTSGRGYRRTQRRTSGYGRKGQAELMAGL